MPVCGFPEMLEHCLSKLMLENRLSSYKIVSSDAGKSTVVLHFEALSYLASELPCCPPRHKSPSKCLRDRERRNNHFSTHNKLYTENNPVLRSASPSVSSSPTTKFLPDPVKPSTSVHGDSGPPTNSKHQQCVLLVSQQPDSQTTPFSKDPETCTTSPVCVVSSTHTDPPVCKTVNSDPKHRDFTCESPEPPPIDTPDHKQSENSQYESDLFWCKEDYEKVVESAKNSSLDTQDKLRDPKRNRVFRRIVKWVYSDDEGGPALVAQSDDLMFTFFTDTKTVGPTIVLSETDMTSKEKDDFDKFRNTPFHRADKYDYMALKATLPELVDFMRDTIQK